MDFICYVRFILTDRGSSADFSHYADCFDKAADQIQRNQQVINSSVTYPGITSK